MAQRRVDRARPQLESTGFSIGEVAREAGWAILAAARTLRRSNFARRAMRPAADGNHHRPRAQPVVPGLVFHGFRHSHKTWLIADGIPEVAQARRLGHPIPDKIQHIYSHVAPEIETRLITALQHRWTTALTTLTTNHHTGTDFLALPPATPPHLRATA